MKQAYYDLDRTRVLCDCCGKELYFPRTEFKSINKELRKMGWKVKETGGRWVEYCSAACEAKGERK